MSPKVRNVIDVAEHQLCTGCGACAFACPESIEMVDDLASGRRPSLKQGHVAEESARGLEVCPGHELQHESPPPGVVSSLLADWGPVLSVWEGHASEPEVRYLGSSGGVATALSLFALESENWSGVLHVRARRDVRYLNEAHHSTTREEVIEATGSRYAPASPCEKLASVRDAPKPSLIVGKPCDVAAAGKAARTDPELAEKIGLTIGIFCAGVPSTRATLELAGELGFTNEDEIGEVRYRGMGWPGRFRVRTHNGEARSEDPPYIKAWGKLQSKRQWRCYVCPDHTGEFADISVGDPWYDGVPDEAPGRSLVVVRTEKGRAFLLRAIESGAVTLEEVASALLPASQPNLLETRGAVWARALVCRALGAAAPRFPGMRLGRLWRRKLATRQKFSSIVGTAKRVFRKRLRRRIPVMAYAPSQNLQPPRSDDNR